MAKRIDAAQIRLAKELRESGESWPAIAKATGASERGLRYQAEKGDWLNKGSKPKPAGKLAGKPANGVEPMGQSEIERIAEVVKSRLANDIEASAIAIQSWQPSELDLPQLEKRERIAESVQKRAANLFDIGKNDQNVVNIAVLSQLPDAVEA